MASLVPGFVGGTLDRADAIRMDVERTAAAFADPRALLLTLESLDPVAGEDGGLAWGPIAGGAAEIMCCWACARTRCRCSPACPTDIPHASRISMAVWTMAATLKPEALALYGTAARCSTGTSGMASAPIAAGDQAGKGRVGRAAAAAVNAEHFPRVDPVTIMLVEYEGKVLIGRQPQFRRELFRSRRFHRAWRNDRGGGVARADVGSGDPHDLGPLCDEPTLALPLVADDRLHRPDRRSDAHHRL